MNICEEYNRNTKSVMLKATSDPNLFVLKYKTSVFHKGTWNDFLRECRGMVVDKDFNIVSLPFRKIHNYGWEADAPEFDADEYVFASRKVNGFMIACTWYNDHLLWSTTGSIDSDFVGYAYDVYDTWPSHQKDAFRELIKVNSDFTYMFECVHPKDPHIVHEDPGLYFIGARPKDTSANTLLADQSSESEFWRHTGVKTVETFKVKFSDLQRMAKECKHEGFVIESIDGTRVTKIKSPHYLSKKLLMRGNWEKFLGNNTRNKLDEEFYPIYDWIHKVEREQFFELDEVARREYIENFFDGYLKGEK